MFYCVCCRKRSGGGRSIADDDDKEQENYLPSFDTKRGFGEDCAVLKRDVNWQHVAGAKKGRWEAIWRLCIQRLLQNLLKKSFGGQCSKKKMLPCKLCLGYCRSVGY